MPIIEIGFGLSSTSNIENIAINIGVIPTIIKVLKIDVSEIDLETRFVEDLGADSSDMYQIAMNLEETFDVSFSEADLKQVVTVNDAYELLKNFKE